MKLRGQVTDILVTVDPFYTRLSIYQPGHFDTVQRCCNGRPASVMRVPIENRAKSATDEMDVASEPQAGAGTIGSPPRRSKVEQLA
jgi:hypothetical protein